jgi:hypothetical protein
MRYINRPRFCRHRKWEVGSPVTPNHRIVHAMHNERSLSPARPGEPSAGQNVKGDSL